MKTSKNPWIYIDYIVESVRFIRQYTSTVSREKFLKDHQVQDAVIRRFQVMGDAAKSVSQEFKNRFPEIPWREMMTQRDVIVHDYFDINFERLWETVQNDLPGLDQKLAKILEQKK